MAKAQEFTLEAVRTDGWFERIGEGIGSFQALCDIVGERFFAFSMITGARITALTVDRRNPDYTLVDFVVGGAEGDAPAEGDGDTQRLTLADFRRRLVGVLLTDEPDRPPPTRDTDHEALQLFVGVRYLLLAPLYGYGLKRLVVEGDAAEIELLYDGVEQSYDLEAFRARIRAHVRDELERTQSGHRGAIDLTQVADAEVAAIAGDHRRVVQLLGAWPAPLAIFLRTPDGQMLAPEARAMIAKGLALLGTACVRLGDVAQGEEVFRLGVQYATEGPVAGDLFFRFGTALLEDGRAGEAVGPLRRAVALGAPAAAVWPMLARAYLARGRWVAAYASTREALGAGVPESALAEETAAIEAALGERLRAYRSVVLSTGR